MAQELQEPNLYELVCGDRRVTYSTSSIVGQPQFSFTDAEGQRTFSGAEIDVLETAFGSFVTVTLESVPDLHVITLTVVLPGIRMSRGEEVSFTTLGLITTAKTTIAGPPPGVGHTYDPLTFDGTAQLVDF